jgi:hypothetical protein
VPSHATLKYLSRNPLRTTQTPKKSDPRRSPLIFSNPVSGQFSSLQTAEPMGRGRDQWKLHKSRLLTLNCESPALT